MQEGLLTAAHFMQCCTKICFAQVWQLAQDGNARIVSANSGQVTDRCRGPDRARRYEEARQERKRRQEEKRAAATLAAHQVNCMVSPIFS